MIAKSLAAEATREIERLLGGDATQTLGDFEAAETAGAHSRFPGAVQCVGKDGL